MKKVIKDTSVYFNGQSQTILAGTEYADNAPIVAKYPAAFGDSVAEKVEVIEEPKEELLVEAPVAELKVEVIEEPKEVEEKSTKKARKRKTKDHDGDVV